MLCLGSRGASTGVTQSSACNRGLNCGWQAASEDLLGRMSCSCVRGASLDGRQDMHVTHICMLGVVTHVGHPAQIMLQ